MSLNIRRAASPLRVEFFKTLPREVTRSISVQYAGTLLDERVDVNMLDHFDCARGSFGVLAHYLIKPSGAIEIGRDPSTRSTRVRNHWATTEAIHVLLTGGYDADGNRIASTTPEQEAALEKLYQQLADALNTPLEIWDARSRWTREDFKTPEEIAEELDAALDANE